MTDRAGNERMQFNPHGVVGVAQIGVTSPQDIDLPMKVAQNHEPA